MPTCGIVEALDQLLALGDSGAAVQAQHGVPLLTAQLQDRHERVTKSHPAGLKAQAIAGADIGGRHDAKMLPHHVVD